MTEKNADTSAIQDQSPSRVDAPGAGTKVVWNDKAMESSYANVVNVATSEDEFMFLFGTSEAWNNVRKEVEVKLQDRIIMTPATAKRFQLLLNKTIEDFEKRKNAH
ncbi:hypothetical protein Thiowin_04699 [Thiorhodovibrio winogradskyi]|uniref:DUF3467 domain-containing protein n=1 Tax=Thiorhodovibrio winogradskyi TaxID=77007 RepID=A0ABZ0SFC1_9GAMM|nr:DUF3467 domain-containing protein [Thiorhodovibrio winogradskyi]